MIGFIVFIKIGFLVFIKKGFSYLIKLDIIAKYVFTKEYNK